MRKKLLTGIILGALSVCCVAGFSACKNTESDDGKATVTFNVNTKSTTNIVKNKSVSVGRRVTQPRVYMLDENPDNLQVYGWYTSPDFSKKWDFKNDRVEKSMTLYAKWVEVFEVNYYLNDELVEVADVFKGDFIQEDITIVEGFEYLGTYQDAGYTSEFDFSAPITKDTNVYMRRSEGIYMSDDDNGRISAGKLSDVLETYVGSPVGKGEEEGWVEAYTVTTNYKSGPVEEKCTYVNFGYAPAWGDNYVEFAPFLDITSSQIISLTFKNLGHAQSMCLYFTAILDVDTMKYSHTGYEYTQDFCYPSVGNVRFDSSQMNMNESDEWITMDFDLSEVYKYGFSIWGTSYYIGGIRIQSNYKNTDPDDLSNVFLIKSIEGKFKEITVEDSANVIKLLSDAENRNDAEFKQVQDAQNYVENGLVFPKQGDGLIDDVSANAKAYNMKEGVLFYSDNEVKNRETNNSGSSFCIYNDDARADIDLDSHTTFKITLQNYGYTNELTAYVYNDNRVPVTVNLKIGTRMTEPKTYTVNLYGKFGMNGKLDHIEFNYNTLGVDNAIVIKSIEFSDFEPYDIVGVNFNDKNTSYYQVDGNVTAMFDPSQEGVRFNVTKSGATVVMNKDNKATNDGYGYAVLNYYMPKTSSVTKVNVKFKLGDKNTSANDRYTVSYVYELDVERKGSSRSVKLPFNVGDHGFVKGMTLTFEGTGAIVIKSIGYEVGETGLPYYESYESVFVKMNDWNSSSTKYEYDNELKASVFSRTGSASMSSAMYIGYSTGFAPHSTRNVAITKTTTFKIVYQNRTNVNNISVIIGLDRTDFGPSDGSDCPVLEHYGLLIDSNMKDFEWSCLTITIPAEHEGLFIAKFALRFEGNSINIRSISIEG